MFTRKAFLAAALLVATGGLHAIAQGQGQDHGQSKLKVAPMSEADQKITKCEVHNTDLSVEDVRLVYGLPFFPEGYWKALETEFPHSKTRALAGCALAGCALSEDAPRFQTVKFCPHCREAEKQWLATHKPNLPKN